VAVLRALLAEPMVPRAVLEWLARNVLTQEVALRRDHRGEPQRWATPEELIEAALAAAGGDGDD